MRPKVVATILILVALLIGATVFLKSRSIPPTESVKPPVASNPAPQPPPAPAPVVEAAPVPPPPAPAPKVAMTEDERQTVIDAEKNKLLEWEANSDSVSYSNILKDLSYPEREVRYAAIEALKQFDDTNAIPVLKDLATKTADLDEARELLDAAKFISLPPADLAGFEKRRSSNGSKP